MLISRQQMNKKKPYVSGSRHKNGTKYQMELYAKTHALRYTSVTKQTTNPNPQPVWECRATMSNGIEGFARKHSRRIAEQCAAKSVLRQLNKSRSKENNWLRKEKKYGNGSSSQRKFSLRFDHFYGWYQYQLWANICTLLKIFTWPPTSPTWWDLDGIFEERIIHVIRYYHNKRLWITQTVVFGLSTFSQVISNLHVLTQAAVSRSFKILLLLRGGGVSSFLRNMWNWTYQVAIYFWEYQCWHMTRSRECTRCIV